MRGGNANIPYFWMDKTAVRKIREVCGNIGDGASTLVVYAALCEIASDKESDRFQTTQEYIAGKACLSVRTVRDKVKVLEKAKLVTVTIPDLRSPGFYELLPMGNGCRTIGNKRRAFGNTRKQASLPTYEVLDNKKEGGEPKKTAELDVQSWRADL